MTKVRGWLPAASVQEVDEVYERGGTVEVVVPLREVGSGALAAMGDSLPIGDRAIPLPVPVERTVNVERYGDLALLTMRKATVPVPAAEPARSPRHSRRAAGLV
ncbi:MAG: hypothetical protein GEU28_10465 [Dehalococcoidia bacterium]|nr:hypothetical protein [Dehalococcoidia bacterium]